MARTVFIEQVRRSPDGSTVEATGIVEMMGMEVRWEAERGGDDSQWAARLLPGQFDAYTEGLADVFLENPPLGEDIERELARVGGRVPRPADMP